MISRPVVLCFSGLDPTGGAGIQADIEAINAQGCHATSVVTALTVQDTRNVEYFECVDAQLILRQARAVLNDMQVSAIKIGMLGNVAVTEAISILLCEHSHIPVILDPILIAGGGGNLSSAHLIATINKRILPYTYIATPNTIEAHKLIASQDTHDTQSVIERLSLTGVKHILLTGTHADTSDVQHRLSRGGTHLQTYNYPRLPNDYHGSGCTLAASLAACIAKQDDIIDATQKSLDYTYESLIHAHKPGKGQLIPNRFIQATK